MADSVLPFEAIRRAAQTHGYWQDRLAALQESQYSVHLAIFLEPYLSYLLEGTKTVESRFSAVRCAPFNRVQEGDAVLLKRSGGPVVGICEVNRVWYYELDPSSWKEIRASFVDELCARDPEFWTAREGASFATLMRIKNVAAIEPTSWYKRDRRGWVVVYDAAQRGLPISKCQES